MAQILDTYRPRGVRDVASDKFIAAYAAHLKAGDKVRAHENDLSNKSSRQQGFQPVYFVF